jgi:hypothetical protein
MKSFFMDSYQNVELKHKIVNNNLFYTVQLQNTVFHRDQLEVSYVFIYVSDCSKSIHGKCKQMLLANDTD